MTTGKACLTCNHVRFIQPSDWKPSFDWESYDRHDVLKVIRETKHHVTAQCTFNPIWIDVTTAHYCGRWDGPIREEHVQQVIWGTWDQQQNTELRSEVKELKARLKKTRSISASRLARLKSNSAHARHGAV